MTFSYPASRLLLVYITCSLAAIGFGSVASLVIYLFLWAPSKLIGNPIGFLIFDIMLISSTAGSIALLALFYKKHRPILISREYISSLNLLGHAQKVINWPDVLQIKRIWMSDIVSRSNHYFFEIHGAKCVIYFNDTIRNYHDLLDELNHSIEKLHIPTSGYDRSPDALRDIKRTIADPDERRRLIRTGRVSILRSL